MNQASLLILLSLIVWARCNLSHSESQPELTQSDEWETNDETDQSPTDDDDDETQIEPADTDINPSASSPVEVMRNQSELNLNLVHFLKNHNLSPQLEQLKRNNNNGQLLLPTDTTQSNLMNDLLRTLALNVTHSSEDPNKNSNTTNNHTHDINDLRKYYQHVKDAAVDTRPQTAQSGAVQEYHANHNYFSNGDWRPLISTSGHPLASWGQPRDAHHHLVPPSTPSRVSSSSEMPTSLANFYVESDRLLHAHESQTNKDLKDAKDSATPTTNIATVKDLISTKDPTGNKGEKLSSVSHKHGNYVPVDDKYQEYLTCCEKLFNNYAHKDVYHEDIYLVPKGEDPMFNRHPFPHPMMVGHHPGLKPVSYLRGYPIIDGDMKMVGPGKDLPPGKHIPVQCLEDHHHSGHLVPAYHGSHPPPMFHAPPPALLLKKKLALLGKKYFFGK